MASLVYVSLLRRPRSNADEMRSDPFWEFGSFGCTGCHRSNLLHPRNAEDLEGARLAFAQGGQLGFRLVYLTPPVKIRSHGDRLETQWRPLEMPFKYASAPILIDNVGSTDFDALRELIAGGRRTTWEGRFASAFRGRTKPLPTNVATEITQVFDLLRRRAESLDISDNYTDALPYKPPKVDRDRQGTLTALREGTKAVPSRRR